MRPAECLATAWRGGVAAAMALCLGACVETGSARLDPEVAAERGAIGGLLGGLRGPGIGSAVAIDSAVGATIGGPAGFAAGAIIGIATADPLPSYGPVALPGDALVPGFYDSWPPGYYAPALGSRTPPPVNRPE